MSVRTLINFVLNNPIRLMVRINRTTREVYRAGFVSTAISEGIYDVLAKGPASCKAMQAAMGSDFNPKGLEAWLDLGVSLGELTKRGNIYRLKSAFSRDLLKKSNDSWKAFFQARIEIFYDTIIQTPALLKQGRQFESSQTHGELLDRPSRTVETIVFDVVDNTVPQKGACRLLEVGCGSGVYIRRACSRNPELTATGVELQRSVADQARANSRIWQIDHRVTIEAIGIQAFSSEEKYNMVTFYNLIYYFPVDERVDVLRRLGGLLYPGGRLILTTLCPANEPSIQLMNLWSSMTVGFGPLSDPDELGSQLKAAGFGNVEPEVLIPGFCLFDCKRGKRDDRFGMDMNPPPCPTFIAT